VPECSAAQGDFAHPTSLAIFLVSPYVRLYNHGS
jgi:hypothetical protein